MKQECLTPFPFLLLIKVLDAMDTADYLRNESNSLIGAGRTEFSGRGIDWLGLIN
jgi:hypothetical protein